MTPQQQEREARLREYALADAETCPGHSRPFATLDDFAAWQACRRCQREVDALLDLLIRVAAEAREDAAKVCEARAKMWQASNANPPKSRRARADEAQSLAAAIRKGEG